MLVGTKIILSLPGIEPDPVSCRQANAPQSMIFMNVMIAIIVMIVMIVSVHGLCKMYKLLNNAKQLNEKRSGRR